MKYTVYLSQASQHLSVLLNHDSVVCASWRRRESEWISNYGIGLRIFDPELGPGKLHNHECYIEGKSFDSLEDFKTWFQGEYFDILL